MTKQRIAIVGGVASGTAAAAEARRTDPDARIVLYEQGSRISYGACEIPLFLDGTVENAEELVAFTPERFEAERGVEVRTNTRVTRIDPRAGILESTFLETGQAESEKYDKFILSTGARAIVPDIEGSDAENVFSIRDLDDAVKLESYISTNDINHAVVVGGGFVGIEVAESLITRGIRITMLQPGAGPLHRHLEDEMAKLVTKCLDEGGVTVRNDRMTGLELSSNQRINAVRTQSGEMIGCQMVVLALGIRANTELGVSAGVKVGESGAYKVTDGMRTSCSNVWACGDCIEVERISDGKQVMSPLSLTAFKTGRVAGSNAARRGSLKPARFEGVIDSQGLKVFNSEVAYVGLTTSVARSAGFTAESVTIRHRTKAALFPGSERIVVTLVFDLAKGRLLGGQLVGGQGTVLRANVLVPILRRAGTVHDLYELDLIYAPPFSPRLDPLLIAARTAIKVLAGSRTH